MKRLSIIFAALLSSALLMGCENNDDVTSPAAADNTFYNVQDDIDSFPIEELSRAEEEGIIFMREEEKLARDVYIYFYNKYGMRIFSNISNAESAHMSALKMLIDKYNLADPVTDNTPGVFHNEELAGLYTQLIWSGDADLLEALKIGARIEDLDIRDLMQFDDEVDNQDVLYVYDNLTKGSRNHLRAFYPQILSNGGTYEAQFISQELFDDIVSSPKETGRP